MKLIASIKQHRSPAGQKRGFWFYLTTVDDELIVDFPLMTDDRRKATQLLYARICDFYKEADISWETYDKKKPEISQDVLVSKAVALLAQLSADDRKEVFKLR